MARLTLADIVCRAADELAAVRPSDDDPKNREKLQRLEVALQFLYDVNTEYRGPEENYAEYYQDVALESLLDDLLYVIRECLMGAPMKGDIPSHETIRSRLA